MAGKQVMDIRVGKGFTKAQSAEHLRIPSKKGKEFAEKRGNNYDESRAHLNFEITKGGKVVPIDKSKSIPQRIAENLAQRGIKDPNKGLDEPRFRTVVNLIFGGSTETMRRLAFGDQVVNYEDKKVDHSHIKRKREIEDWARDIYHWAKKRWGEENIVAFVVHLDESNPHIHCTLLPIIDDKFSYRKIFAGKDKFEYSARMKELHSSLAEVNRRWNLDRGDPVAETGAKHRTTEQYRRELTNECTRLEAEIRRKTIALKGLNTMINNLRSKVAEKEQDLIQLQKLMKERADDKKLLEEQQKIIKQIEELKEQLKDKEEKYNKTVQAIAQAEERKKTIEQRTNESIEKLRGYVRKEIDYSHGMVSRAVLGDVIAEMKELLPQLSDEDREVFEGSLIEDLMENARDIAEQSVHLFMDVVGDATTFARGSGGGGSSHGDWGRKKDEDDIAWARRCSRMARHFVRARARRPRGIRR